MMDREKVEELLRRRIGLDPDSIGSRLVARAAHARDPGRRQALVSAAPVTASRPSTAIRPSHRDSRLPLGGGSPTASTTSASAPAARYIQVTRIPRRRRAA
jgi:hypothetical protein